MEAGSTPRTHKLSMDNRKQMNLTGIKDVVAFDLNQVLLESNLGMVHIKGSDLKVTKLTIEKEISSSTDGSSYGYDSSDRLWQQCRWLKNQITVQSV